MKISSAKAKGRRLQQDICKRILAMFPTLEQDDVKSCPMGSHGEDIQLSPAARELFPFSVECKASKNSTIQTHYEQAAKNAPKGTIPIVVTKADRKGPLVTMVADDFERLVKK